MLTYFDQERKHIGLILIGGHPAPSDTRVSVGGRVSKFDAIFAPHAKQCGLLRIEKRGAIKDHSQLVSEQAFYRECVVWCAEVGGS